jgi:hypothetical protein
MSGVPVAAPWAIAFSVYVVIRVARDAYDGWVVDRATSDRLENALRMAEEARQALSGRLDALDAELRVMQSQASFNASGGIPFVGVGPTFGPVKHGQ